MNTIFMSLTLSKIIAVSAIAALLVASFAFTSLTRHAGAADLTSVSDTLSDSDLGVNADHSIQFTNPTATTDGQTIVLEFEEEFNLSTSTATLGLEDFDVATTSEITLAYDCATGDEQWSVATNTPNTRSITFTMCAGNGGGLAANSTTTIQIGTNATTGGAGDNQIINPTQAGSYVLQIFGSITDAADTMVAIIDDVVVTAEVPTIFTFVVNGLPAGITGVNGSAETTSTTTSATSLPFGVLSPGTPNVMAQNLQVTTNARNGFTVTAEMDQRLTSSTGADIDRFTDDSGNASTTVWAGPIGTLGLENTYGHMGITSEDETLGDTDITTHFYNDLWAGNFVGNPREVFYHDGPSDGSTADIGSTTVGFQAEIMSFQEAGTDYTANLTYVATPVF